MLRRSFLAALAATGVASRLEARDSVPEAPARPSPRRQPSDRLIMDAMGELRLEYEPPLIREMLASGMDAITITLGDPKVEGDAALALALDELAAYDRFIARHADLLLKATSAADVDVARRSGRLAVFYQNTVQFGASLDRIALFHRLGLRTCQLTYNTRNLAGVGCYEEGGLTPFGRELIARMNAERMLVDLSHANMRTMGEAIAASRAPVVVSHTVCAAVHPHRRATTDENLRALAARGGVVGIAQLRPFLTTRKTDTLAAYLDHLLHAVRVAGAEHVAIGSDRDHRRIDLTPEYIAQLRAEAGGVLDESELPWFIPELNGPRRMEVVWDGLVRRGLGSADVARVMGGNLLRLYRDVIG
jgi:membrane dipeptidase